MQSDTFENLRAEWEALGVESPRIVQVSFGPMWALTPKDTTAASGLLPIFLNQVLPQIEKQALNSDVAKRMLWGHSMGGLNSSILALSAPEMFARIAMTSPAPLLAISPYSTAEEVEAYARKTQLPVDAIQEMIRQHKIYVDSTESFQKISIIAGGVARLGANTPPLYISGSEKDFYYYYGIRQLVTAIASTPVKLTYEELPGGHRDVNYASLAKFLSTQLVKLTDRQLRDAFANPEICDRLSDRQKISREEGQMCWSAFHPSRPAAPKVGESYEEMKRPPIPNREENLRKPQPSRALLERWYLLDQNLPAPSLDEALADRQ